MEFWDLFSEIIIEHTHVANYKYETHMIVKFLIKIENFNYFCGNKST